ncbi:hypothetical protein [Gilvimarinus polysaccharolyticus]|uniref:hypothetical protein n=1 Tax=Gilvimarinus polysaccharolyticus TaxID=863921 RepID=UPI000673A823|nr:hypothetical protein [Gilvimarinus polysaccharolyticus]
MNLQHKLLALFLVFNANYLYAEDLTGTWELVGGEFKNVAGEMLDYHEEKFVGVKVINADHFSFVSKRDGEFWAAASGPYSATDTHYTETPNIASFGEVGNDSYEFRYRLEGNSWHTERFVNDERVEYEHWRRVTP